MPELLDGSVAKDAALIRRRIRTPRSAAVAGLVFSVLLIVALVLLQLAVGATPGRSGAWLTNQTHRRAVQVALGLIPFAASGAEARLSFAALIDLFEGVTCLVAPAPSGACTRPRLAGPSLRDRSLSRGSLAVGVAAAQARSIGCAPTSRSATHADDHGRVSQPRL